MISRLVFLTVVAFWVAMNVLLWRAEYGAPGRGIAVPVDLVWRKILTAPDASSLTVYQGGEKTGFCEFSTSVEQAMAAFDGDRPPPEGLGRPAGYQIRFDGNVSLGDFTNRLAFNGRIEFVSDRVWRELNLRLTSHGDSVEIHSIATNQTFHLKLMMDGVGFERDLTFADLQHPDALIRSLAGDWGAGLSGLDLFPGSPTRSLLVGETHWEAHHVRLLMGGEPVSAYRLETRFLDRPVIIFVSTLGEILRVELPGGLTATLDQLGGT